jgi:hypothetical protein
MHGAIPSLPQYNFMAQYLIKQWMHYNGVVLGLSTRPNLCLPLNVLCYTQQQIKDEYAVQVLKRT